MIELDAEGTGYFSKFVPAARSFTLYRFRLDDEKELYPDPASRAQPEGPHGPSEVIDPGSFRWTDKDFSGVRLEGQIIYEMHIGTFTREGTWEAAERELPELAQAGITLIELMPVCEFPGRFGWGYDGVNLFAPTRLYGRPDDLRSFVDRAHSLGMGVILDVVYNHLGPDGNYLGKFTGDYFTDKHTTDWGAAIRFYGENAGPVREYFLSNAGYWIDEFHLDGLRLDATQNIYDDSEDHILAAIGRRVREAAGSRATILVAENEPQESKLVRPSTKGGYGLDAVWNDDFHHSATVALTGNTQAYYTDHRGVAQEFVSALKWGYLFQGQRYAWQKQRRGKPAFDLAPAQFVLFIDNHDQIANSDRGKRAHQSTSPGKHRAMTALLLLAPGTPMLFQGQEFSASAPFLFFADHKPELRGLVKKGRAEFLAQFPSYAQDEVQRRLDDPADYKTFERCKLDFTERERHAEAYALHKDLLALRRSDPVLRAQRARGIDGAVLTRDAFVIRYFDGEEEDRILIVNFGADLNLPSLPEPLLAPPSGSAWAIRFSSEDPRYGGRGTPPVDTEQGFRIPGLAAVYLAPEPLTHEKR